MCTFILNVLKSLNLSDGWMRDWTRAVSIVVEIESVPDAAKIANMVVTGAGEG